MLSLTLVVLVNPAIGFSLCVQRSHVFTNNVPIFSSTRTVLRASLRACAGVWPVSSGLLPSRVARCLPRQDTRHRAVPVRLYTLWPATQSDSKSFVHTSRLRSPLPVRVQSLRPHLATRLAPSIPMLCCPSQLPSVPTDTSTSRQRASRSRPPQPVAAPSLSGSTPASPAAPVRHPLTK